jgi:Na+-driven multidrug efflux pump
VLSGYGSVAIAAYTVGVRLLAFTWIPGTAFGTAASTLVGQALGAGRRDAAAQAGWRANRLSLVVASCSAARAR